METMESYQDLTINIKGTLMHLGIPKVMGILNVTPDSFFSQSRCITEDDIIAKLDRLYIDGADIIDVGGCSTRPGGNQPSVEEEWKRIELVLKIIDKSSINLPVSIDTYRHEIAERGVRDYGVAIINDISGGSLDPKIWETVADLHVPYVLTHMRGTPVSMANEILYNDVTADVIKELSWKLNELHRLGVCDVIIDPGFGFAKTRIQNFQLLKELEEFCLIGLPVMVGFSRKSMIYQTLGCGPEEALTGTVVLNTIALMKGASILRVHDVKEAVETVKLIKNIRNTE